MNCLLCSALALYLLSVPPTKKELKNAISIKDELSHVNEWLAKNDDSCYFKSDTITLYRPYSYRYHPNTCRFIRWSFSRHHKFSFAELKMCQEPPVVGYRTGGRYSYRYSIKEKE